MEVTVRLTATPAYAAASQVSLPPAAGAVIAGGEQHQDEIYSSVVIQAILAEGERLLCVLGVERNASNARRLVEVDLPQRNSDAELALTQHRWRFWLRNVSDTGPYRGTG